MKKNKSLARQYRNLSNYERTQIKRAAKEGDWDWFWELLREYGIGVAQGVSIAAICYSFGIPYSPL